MDKWFSVQASAPGEKTFSRVQELLRHESFDLMNPNKVRSLIGSFVRNNPTQFHHLTGRGYEFLVDILLRLDPVNPQVSARMVDALVSWRRYDKTRQALMQKALIRLSEAELSNDLYEKVSKSLSE